MFHRLQGKIIEMLCIGKNGKEYVDMRSEKIKNIILDIVYDIIGSFFYAVGVYTFAKMANFAPVARSPAPFIKIFIYSSRVHTTWQSSPHL